jgi:hypothetical protein
LSDAVTSLSAKAPVGQSLETNPGSLGDPGRRRFRALFSHLATNLRLVDRLTVLKREVKRAVYRDSARGDQRVQVRWFSELEPVRRPHELEDRAAKRKRRKRSVARRRPAICVDGL